MWQITPYAPITLAAALTAFGAAFALAPRLRVRGGPALLGMLLAGGWWSLLYTAQLSRTDLEGLLGFARWQQLGVVSLPLFWLAFARELVGRPLRLRVVALLSLVPLLGLLAVFAFPDTRLAWRGARAVGTGFVTLELERGPAFYLVGAYLYTLLVAGQATVVRWAARAPRPFRTQALVLLTGTLPPLIANLVWVLGPPARFDPTPLGFALGAAMVAWGVVRYGMLDLVPVARHVVVDSIEDGVLVFDLAGRLVDANRAGLRFVGVGAAEALGRAADELLGPDVSAPPGEGGDRVASVERLDRVYDLRLSPLRHRGRRRGRVAVIRDVSARVRQEQALREAMEEAERANRVTGRFLATMSHELRTPLTAILGYGELLRSGAAGPLTEEQAPHLEEVLVSGRRLFALISNLLDYAKLETEGDRAHEEWIDPAPLLEGLARTYGERARGKGLDFALSLPAELPRARTDAAMLEQVLDHLLDNALKFTTDGEVALRAHRREGALAIEVADTGVGISVEEERRIFDAFAQASEATTTRPYGGSGLGLALCRRLCRAIGAELSLESAPGRGSTFRVTVPVGPV